ncbi:tetratricopeptide repeat protein [Epilithonimonas arachidiradicis]|uniref:Uncharacterized protein n=1 Tax=Epilithonimonas arachidiradicis TaxID=1617282 RepID=A0A420DCJ2_9FLAO|nr:tetratricopeptide repeat protein [Epilithonimonas arachidiradicis]RKE89571.1 hypothetical protein BXY58_0140 [Epilithonimonas arachidiradicis]GGG43537.1 hypothetical protein GCM10007332_01300 [Epilithonimonas arachidiradicis]
MITRKNFLKVSSLGLASVLIPNFLFSKSLLYPFVDDVTTLLKQARRYRRQGRFAKAKTIYQQILSIDNSELRAYNGIRKILLKEKHKELEVIQLYQQALSNVPNNFRLKRSLYGEYLRASIGNQKLFRQLNLTSGRPLSFVKQKFDDLLLEHPNNKNIQNQVAKIDQYIAMNVDTMYAHKNKALKQFRKNNKKAHKNRFATLTSVETTQKLADLNALPVNPDRQQHIREMSQVNIKALRADKDYTAALTATEDYLTGVNSSDAYFIKQFRDLSKQLNQYDKLINFETQNHAAKNTFWSAIALFDAYQRKAEKMNQQPTANMDTLLQFIKSNYNNPMQRFEAATRKIKLSLLKNELNVVRELLIEQCKEKMLVSDSHSIDRINILIAKYWKKSGESDYKKILSICSLPNDYLQSTDELISNASLMNMNRAKNKAVHIDQLQYRISKL